MLVMAPEGTTGDGRCILQFRTGAFVPGVPVLPVCLAYGKRCHNPAWTIINEPFHFVRSWPPENHAHASQCNAGMLLSALLHAHDSSDSAGIAGLDAAASCPGDTACGPRRAVRAADRAPARAARCGW